MKYKNLLTLTFKNITTISSLPVCMIKTKQCSVYANITALFINFIGITWTHSGGKRNYDKNIYI